MLSGAEATARTRLLSTGNLASVTEEFNFECIKF